jgi:undecaprenyl-diphosphatase
MRLAVAGNPSRASRPDPRRSIAFAAGILAAAGFVAMGFVVYAGDRTPLPLDVWWHGLMVGSLSAPGVVLAWIPSEIGGTIGMIVIAIGLVAVLLWRRRRWEAAEIAIAIAIVVAIGAPMSYIVARVRPGDSLAENTATSFPSGHTAVATTVAITLALLLRRWYVWAAGVLWVLWMMWARTYLHAHWLTDVFAGLLEGIAVSTLVWCAVQAVHDRRAARSTGSSPATS